MQDDRSRLAVELDAALDRSRALEAANVEAGERLAHAAKAIGASREDRPRRKLIGGGAETGCFGHGAGIGDHRRAQVSARLQ